MKKKKSLILWIALLSMIAAITIGYAVWNKPHPKVEDQQATAVTAQTLYADFAKNEQQANGTYLKKVLQVKGVAAEVSKNQDGKSVVVLGADDPLGGVQCTFRDVVNVQPGQEITVKGFCNGYTMVVLLNDCVIN